MQQQICKLWTKDYQSNNTGLLSDGDVAVNSFNLFLSYYLSISMSDEVQPAPAYNAVCYSMLESTI